VEVKESPQIMSRDEEPKPTSSSIEVDAAVEASVRKKLDWRLMPISTLVYFLAFIDRSNAGS